MGLGIAAGAVTAMMLPRQSCTRRAIQKAAGAVEDAASSVSCKITHKMDK
jgi:hypothetical protein